MIWYKHDRCAKIRTVTTKEPRMWSFERCQVGRARWGWIHTLACFCYRLGEEWMPAGRVYDSALRITFWYYTRDGERAPAAWDERASAASLIKAISWKIPRGFTGRNHDHCAAGGEHEGSCPSDQQGQTCFPPFSPRVFLRSAVSFIFTGRKQKSPGSRARRNQFLTGNVMQGCSHRKYLATVIARKIRAAQDWSHFLSFRLVCGITK